MSGVPGSSKSRAQAHAFWEYAGLAAIVGLVSWFYLYLCAIPAAAPWVFRAERTDYYHDLADGFLHGQLSLMTTPDPGLATLSNPYDPVERVRAGHPGMHDASYYKGRYYLYFGVAPALALFVPFKLFTGLHFPQPEAVALFCVGGYLAYLAIFLSLRRRFFPATGIWVAWLGALMLGLGNFCAPMLVRSHFWEVPIASAYCFFGLAAFFLYRAIGQAGGRVWLGLGSAALGLAVASRPHFVFASAAFGLVAWWRWREREGAGSARGRLAMLDGLALGLPLAVAVLGLLAYNYLRFDFPFDFGQRYQMSGSNQLHMQILSPSSIPANLYYYFLAPATVGRYFPFFDTIIPYPGTLPKGYYGIENPFGLLANMPAYWLAVAAPLLWLRRYRRERQLGQLLALWATAFLALCGFTLCFISATNRYMVDFLPPLLSIAGLGLLMLADPAWRAPGQRCTAGAAALVLIVGYTAFFNLMVPFQYNGIARHNRLLGFQAWARVFNLPASWWDSLSGRVYGPAELTVKFSPQAVGRNEPLLVAGTAWLSDFVYVYHTGTGRVQVGATHAGQQVMSQPIPVDYDQPHHVTIDAGVLYPPASHRYFSRLSPEAALAAKRVFRVAIDGVPYLETELDSYDTPPGLLTFGENRVSDYGGKKFTGQLLSVKRRPWIVPVGPFAGDAFVRLGLIFPAEASGRSEPLVGTGKAGFGDLLYAIYDSATQVRLGFRHSGNAALTSEPLPVEAGKIQVIEASLGSFYRDGPMADPDLPKALVVRLNGQLVWAEQQVFWPRGPEGIVFGANPGLADGVLPSFTGKVVARLPFEQAQERDHYPFQFEPYWVDDRASPGFGKKRIMLEWPADRSPRSEPLLVSGSSVNEADYVWVNYVDQNRVILGYEHTSGGGPRSEAITIGPGAKRGILELDLPSLYPRAGSGQFFGRSGIEISTLKNRGRISLDGVIRVESKVKSYESTPAQASVGENKVSQTFGRQFSGKIVQVLRAALEPPPGFDEREGPLELEISWPGTAGQGRETIMASGSGEAWERLSVERTDLTHARFVFTNNRGANRVSSLVEIDPAKTQKLRLDWGGFYPDAAKPADIDPAEWAKRRSRLGVWLDDRSLLDAAENFSFGVPQRIWIGSTDGQDSFSGIVRSALRRDNGSR